MDFLVYAAGIAFAACAGTIAGGVLNGPVAHRPLQPRLYEWINRYMGLGSIGLMLASFYWYGFLGGLSAIGVAILFGALLFSLSGSIIPRLPSAVIYSVAAIILLVTHVFLYPDLHSYAH